MTDSRHIVDLIEQASDAQPYCACGWHTSPVWRDGVVWLDCASLNEPRHGIVRRILAAATEPAHVHFEIVNAPAPTTESVAARL